MPFKWVFTITTRRDFVPDIFPRRSPFQYCFDSIGVCPKEKHFRMVFNCSFVDRRVLGMPPSFLAKNACKVLNVLPS